jgi:hypothetical protein
VLSRSNCVAKLHLAVTKPNAVREPAEGWSDTTARLPSLITACQLRQGSARIGSADIKLRDIEEKIRALQAMRRALRRLVSQCDGKLPASECPILESLNVDAQVYTWCAWDTLFLPELLEKSARVESGCDATEKPVRLSVSPKRVESADPGSVCISFLRGQLALPTRHRPELLPLHPFLPIPKRRRSLDRENAGDLYPVTRRGN